MNKRIQQLMALAQEDSFMDGLGGPRMELNPEKFAELIIEECSKVNNQFIGHRIGEIDLDLIYKEHFGVE